MALFLGSPPAYWTTFPLLPLSCRLSNLAAISLFTLNSCFLARAACYCRWSLGGWEWLCLLSGRGIEDSISGLMDWFAPMLLLKSSLLLTLEPHTDWELLTCPISILLVALLYCLDASLGVFIFTLCASCIFVSCLSFFTLTFILLLFSPLYLAKLSFTLLITTLSSPLLSFALP